MSNEQSQYRLVHGCWRGTLTSRDVAEEIVADDADARKKLDEHARFYRSIGYTIWFANLHKPDGTTVKMA